MTSQIGSQVLPGDDQFPITPVMKELDWSPLSPPFLTQFLPQGSNSPDRDPNEPDPNFERLLRFRQVMIWQLATEDPSPLGLGRSYEGTESRDEYLFTIKFPTYQLAKRYWEKLRDLLINYPKLKNNPQYKPYNRYEFQGFTLNNKKSRYLYEFTVVAYRSGKVRPIDG